MAETIEDKVEQLERSNNEKECFINNFTHELKTPLTSIIGYANFLQGSKYDEQLFFEAAHYIYKESKYLEKMSFKMMDLIYSKSQNLTLVPVSLREVVEEAEESLKGKLEEKKITLIIEGDSKRLRLDATLMKMLISNLLENAIKASSEGAKILVQIIPLEEQVQLIVKDFGIGIGKEHLDKICEPFYIIDPARTRKGNGAGIGLAICKKIIDAHNAKLHIESKPGKGTMVMISFPI